MNENKGQLFTDQEQSQWVHRLMQSGPAFVKQRAPAFSGPRLLVVLEVIALLIGIALGIAYWVYWPGVGYCPGC